MVDAGATSDINGHISISNTFRYNSFRIDGDMTTTRTSLQKPVTGAQQTVVVSALGNSLTDRTSYWNTLELNLNSGKKFSANLGWRAMHRDITLSKFYRSTSVTTPSSAAPTVTTIAGDESESVNTNTFIGGVRFRPSHRASFFFDVEHGTNNNAFVRITLLEFTRFRFRTQVQATNSLSL